MKKIKSENPLLSNGMSGGLGGGMGGGLGGGLGGSLGGSAGGIGSGGILKGGDELEADNPYLSSENSLKLLDHG